MTLAILGALVGTAGAAARPARDIPPELRERIISEAYAKLTERVATGGQQISFKLENLRTVEPAEFAAVPWRNVVTMPGGDMIDMAREISRLGEQVVGVAYRPRWQLGAPDFFDRPAAAPLVEMTISDVLRDTARERPAAATTSAITAFEVTVAYQEHERHYRAAVLWLEPKRGRDASLFIVDHITQGVEEALRDRIEPVRARFSPPPAKTLQCQQSASSHTVHDMAQSSSFHDNQENNHHGGASVQFQCACASNCVGTCTPVFLWTDCDDTEPYDEDNPAMCHKMSPGTEQKVHGSTNDGRQGVDGCSAGFACFMKRCLWCNCALGISVNIVNPGGPGAVTFQFQSDDGPDWNVVNYTFNNSSCPACVELTDPGDDEEPYEPDEDDPWPPPPPGGGPSGNCCWWRTSCYVDYRGWYTCTPTSCGQWGC